MLASESMSLSSEYYIKLLCFLSNCVSAYNQFRHRQLPKLEPEDKMRIVYHQLKKPLSASPIQLTTWQSKKYVTILKNSIVSAYIAHINYQIRTTSTPKLCKQRMSSWYGSMGILNLTTYRLSHSKLK